MCSTRLVRFRSFGATAILILAAACNIDQPTEATKSGLTRISGDVASLESSDALLALGNRVNTELVTRGANYRLAKAEWLNATGQPDASGKFVFFDDKGSRLLEEHFVPGDPRRGGHASIKYLVDQVDVARGLTADQTTAAIDGAMATWDGLSCSNLPLTLEGHFAGFDLGFVQFLIGFGGFPGVFADVTHAGWMPGFVFEFLDLPPGVLAVTFTFIFSDDGVNATDIDGNGRGDAAFREIYYNDAFAWGINAAPPRVDVESVALHESGHGLSQAHFGKAFLTLANGKVHFAPLAVMNAGYSGIQQKLRGTDNAGHCSQWSTWPQP